jgi:hypothetical protein
MSKLVDDSYMNLINKRCLNIILLITNKKSHGKQEKVTDYELVVPTKENVDDLFKYNYNKDQLKFFAKHYSLKLAGNKKDLLVRIYCFLKLSDCVSKIQKIIRGVIQRKYNKSHGPAHLKRNICTNSNDFFTMDELSSVPFSQFFSYKDSDGFIYGFDIISLYNLIKKSEKEKQVPTNPYNRKPIPKSALSQVKRFLRLSKVLKQSIQIEINYDENNLSSKKSVELRVLDLFQSMDALGNYTSPEWFASLTLPLIVKYLRELIDIWNYRSQIPIETKRNICPPHGDPFRTLNINSFLNEQVDLESCKISLLEILEKLVNTGINHDSRLLGSYYVLGAFTLVNDNAAASLPWLYQSFAYV